MRDARTNPFDPDGERVPRVWAGRHDQLADWRDRLRPRRLGGQGEPGRVFLGQPGIGTSVLVRRIAAHAAEAGDLVTEQVRVHRGVDPLPQLTRALLRVADAAGLAERRESAVQSALRRVSGLGGGGADPDAGEGQAVLVLRDLLLALGRAGLHDGRLLLVHVDSVHNIDDAALSKVLAVLTDALSHEEEMTAPTGQRLGAALPIAVYLTGLPEFQDRAASVTDVDVPQRFRTTVLRPLEDADVRGALRPFAHVGWSVPHEGGERRVAMSPEAIERIVETCHGDPFMLQLVGKHAWEAGDDNLVDGNDVRRGWTAARPEAVAHVERLLERLPDLERSFVDAMAAMEPAARTATNIARALGYDRAAQVGAVAQRLDTIRGLVERGKPYGFRVRVVEAYLRGDWP